MHPTPVPQPRWNIIRFPVIEWNFRWQRPQQISVQFADHGHLVFYLSLDTHVIEDDHAGLEEIASRISIRQLHPRVWWVKLCSRHRLNVYTDVISDPRDVQYLVDSIRALKQRFQIQWTLSIVDLPFWSKIAAQLPHNYVIYDCMDDHAGFSTNDAAMLSEEQTLLQEADIVIASSGKLYEQILPMNPNTCLIRNGGEFEHFSVPPGSIPPELPDRSGPIIGYYGAISDWFDIELIALLANKHPEWTFVLIGSTFGCKIEAVEGLDNVVLTGEKPYSSLPQYVHCFDVCLIPFTINDLTLATNPVKLYEYLAAGKPVVASRLPELEAIPSSLIHLADTPEQFETAILKALLSERSEPCKQQSIQARHKFARQNSWNNRYQELHAILTQQLYPLVSIVIVAYNNWKFTRQCLSSLFAAPTYPHLEVIVIDNGSTDATSYELRRIRHPALHVISLHRNMGFAGGISHGLNAAKGEIFILLNNDTLVTGDWIERLIHPLRRNKELGMVGPVSNHVGNEQIVDHFVGNGIQGPDPDWLQELYEQYEGRLRETEMLGFFCVAFTRRVYTQVGELDAGFAIGMFEDNDYCERVKQKGYRFMIVEDAFVYHHGSMSFKRLSKQQYGEIFEQNRAYFEQKWNKPFMPYKGPDSIFYLALDSETVAERLRSTGQPTVLLLGDLVWETHATRTKQLANACTKLGYLVIAYVHNYHSEALIGIRKLGPNLYLTNRFDLFDQSEFDAVVLTRPVHTKFPYSPVFIADSYSLGANEQHLLNQYAPLHRYTHASISKFPAWLHGILNQKE